MNREDPQSSSQPLEDESKTTSGATVLFSRKDVMPSDDSGTKAAPETAAPAAGTTQEKTTVAASVMPTQKADLTGIFRKVQLENPGDGNERTELISSQQAESSLSAGKNDGKNSEQEFTQIFQTLSSAKGKGDNAARTDGKPDAPQPGATQYGGDFTQLLRTLSAEAEAEAEIPAVPAPLPQQPVSGPGEFTRIISGAMLREAQGRIGALERTGGQKSSAASNAIPAKSAAAPPRKQRVPDARPAPPPPPVKTPSAVPAPQASPDAAPAQSKLQQYMPLLLIANFFLMLAVLVLLAVVFLHRYKT